MKKMINSLKIQKLNITLKYVLTYNNSRYIEIF